MAGFHLAIFNEVQYANWYLVNLENELKENNTSDFPADGPFYILEILGQTLWDVVRKTVLADSVAKDAVINPCEGNEHHRCPMVPINFDEYADFNKLKEMFVGYPSTHFEADIAENN